MNRLFYIILFLGGFSCVAQFPETPPSYSKIHFVYQRITNFTFTEEGVSADTLLIQKELTGQSFHRITDPNNPLKVIGFIRLSELSPDSKQRLVSIVFHVNSRREFVYNAKRKITKCTTEMAKDAESQRIFRMLDTEAVGIDAFPTSVRYLDNGKIRRVGSYGQDFSPLIMKWITENKVGTYEQLGCGFLNTNSVIVDQKLSKYITPILLFENCDYGIETMYSLEATTSLVSVDYEK